MAKRFTDTDKWKRPWFADLDVQAKLAWIYLLDNCDHTGVWHTNYGLMSYQLGYKVTEKDFKNWFGSKIQVLENDKIFVPSFIDFQYGNLNPNNNAHKAVIKVRSSLGAAKPQGSPKAGALQGAQDKDMDTDKDKDKDMVKDTDKDKDKVGNALIKNAYVAAFKERYGVEPLTRNAAFNGQVVALRKKLGVEDAVEVVKFYLAHNDGWFLKNTHSFGICLAQAETLYAQWMTGRQVTGADVRRMEKNATVAQMITDAKKGGF